MSGLLDFTQSASNAVAGNVAGPIDLIAMGLRGIGIPVPQDAFGSTEWMKRRGLIRDVEQGPARVLGETAGLLGPVMATQFAPKIAGGLLRAGENIAAPATLNKQAGVLKIGSYAGDHRPMTVEGGAARLHDLTPAFGDDVYGPNALQYFGSGDARERKAIQIMKRLRNNPDAMVDVYRGVPDGVDKINPGDWVTLLPEYAQEYGKVISMKVPAKSVTSWPDSLAEFGYYPD